MNASVGTRETDTRRLEPLLAVAGKLAAPFDLPTMLREVAQAAVVVLQAERSAVWLYDAAADELVLEISSDVPALRVKADKGLVGACARTRKPINVPDCYADPRFDSAVDKRTGYRTRCALTLPLVDHEGVLVGVMQVLNKSGGVFEAEDESLALVLAAQCAIALQRVKMTRALLEGERMRRELEMARQVQMSTLPARMPSLAHYDIHGSCHPADSTGGDTFDVLPQGERVLLVLGDATGHGIAPALSVTQMQAMLRMSFRLGADLETTFQHVNNQLAESLPDDRFITAFIGVLDLASHALRFHSGGQGPIMRFRAATRSWDKLPTTSFPLAAMPMPQPRAASTMDFAPGDILVLVTDGLYEHRNSGGEYFGEERVRELVEANHRRPAHELTAMLLAAVRDFAGEAPQEDDMTLLVVKRDPLGSTCRGFARSVDSLTPMADWTRGFFGREGLNDELRPPIDLAIEELFTNMVKYGGPSQRPVVIALRAIPGGVDVALTDTDVDRFDVTQTAAPATDQPLQARSPGGLGLHLVRQMVEDYRYEYNEVQRQCIITFRKTTRGRDAGN